MLHPRLTSCPSSIPHCTSFNKPAMEPTSINPSTIQDEGERSLSQGQFETAIALYQALLPTDPSCIWPLGVAYVLVGDEESAQVVWMEAIAALTPDEMGNTLSALYRRLLSEAERQLQQRRFEPAERAFRYALELDAESGDALLGLGQAIAFQGRYDEACDCWETATALNPTAIAPYLEQGRTYHFLRDWNAAILSYKALLQQEPEHVEALHGLGQCLLRVGDGQGAIAYLQQAFQLQPNHGAIGGDLGWAWLRLGNLSKALQTWQIVLVKQSSFVRDYGNWEHALEQQQRSTPHLHLNATLLHTLANGDTHAALLALGQRLQQMGWQAGAKACLEAVGLDEFPSDNPLASNGSSSTPQPSDVAEVPGPIGFYETTEAWAKTTTATYQPIYPASEMPLQPPHSLEAALHPSFRFGSGVPLPGSFVATVPNGRYWIEETSQVAAIAPNNRILGDVSPFSPILSPGHPAAHPSQHPLLRRPTLPPPRRIDGNVAVLSSLSNGVYFHWMLDVLPRLALLHQAGVTPDQVDYYLIDASQPFQRETLERLGIPLEKILSPLDQSHWEARSLLLPSFPASISWVPAWVCEFLRQTFLPPDSAQVTPGRRFYISRARASVRRLINEREVVQVLAPLGFETVYLEEVSVQEQAALFAQADVVVSLHGSGLTNLVFCQPGTTVIELFSPEYVYPCYWLIANWRQLHYYYLLGSVPEGLFLHQILYPDSRQEDVWVDPKKLLTLLNSAIPFSLE